MGIDHTFAVILFLLPEESHWLLAEYGRHVLNEARKQAEHLTKCLEILNGIFEPWTWNWKNAQILTFVLTVNVRPI